MAHSAVALTASSVAEEPTSESLPACLTILSIDARPAAIDLKHKFDYRQILLTGKLESGETVDLTRMAKATQEGSSVTVSADGLVRAKADGSGKLTFSFEGKSVEVPVTVSGVEAPHAVSFVRDVQ